MTVFYTEWRWCIYISIGAEWSNQVRTEDGQLIRKCLDGEPEAFGFLVDRYRESVYALAYSKLGNLHDAEDITQEVFIKAYQKLRALRRWDSFHAWIYAITSNLCKNWIRAHSKQPDREFIEDQDPGILQAYSTDSHSEELICESVREALHSLPEIHRQVLTLFYLGGMSTKEIARFLGTSPNTIIQRLYAARSRLKEEMLAMMQTTLEEQRLPVGFTLRIVETVKRIRIQPLSRNPGFPWGISIAAGIIIAFLTFGSHISLPRFPDVPADEASLSQIQMTKPSEIPVHMLDSSQLPINPGYRGYSNGGRPDLSTQQNAILMAPRGEGGVFPEEPSARLGKGTLGGVAYSPDGKFLAVACGVGIRLYDAFDLKEIALLQGYSYDGAIDFSPDGMLLASAGSWWVNGIDLWDVTEQEQIGTLDVTSYVYSLAFSPDGRILASGGQDRSVRLWDIEERKQIGALKGHTTDRIRSVAFSPDGEILASGSDDNTIRLWSVQKQREIGLLQGHTAGVQSVAFSSDGGILASGSSDKTIRLWDVQEQKQTGVLHGHTETVWSVAFSPDGKILASASYDKTIRLWDAQEQKQAREPLENQSSPSYAAFSPDGKTLASGDRSGSLRFWDVQEWKQTEVIEGFTNNFIYSLAFSPDGKILASGGSYTETLLWDIQEQKEIGSLEEGSSWAGASSFAFTPDGKTIASTHQEEINLYSVQDQKKLGTLRGHTDFVRSIVFSPDGKNLISGGMDHTVRIWDLAKQKEVAVLRNGSHAHCVSISPDGETIAAAIGGESLVRLWDAETHKEIGILKHPQRAAMSVSFSPDGKTLASGNAGGLIYLWDYQKNKLIGQLQGDIQLQENPTWAYPYFSPDGKLLAAVYWEGFALIWDVEEQEQISTIEGHYLVRAVTFSPDGKWLATAGDEGTILLWEVNMPVEGRSVEPTGKLPGTWGGVKKTELLQNYPNPFNPETWIPYQLTEDVDVTVSIRNLSGQVVRKLNLGHKPAGSYIDKTEAAYWDGTNEVGEEVASDVYFYTIQAGDYTATRKMIARR
jgi:RNA polymerase sigma factor (sigma-70 family)